jgi:hypothetical protein
LPCQIGKLFNKEDNTKIKNQELNQEENLCAEPAQEDSISNSKAEVGKKGKSNFESEWKTTIHFL